MFDSDRDGAINFNEFSALWDYINQWTQCFRSFDVDGSGNIDKRELSMALSKFGYLSSWNTVVYYNYKTFFFYVLFIFSTFPYLFLLLKMLEGNKWIWSWLFTQQSNNRMGLIRHVIYSRFIFRTIFDIFRLSVKWSIYWSLNDEVW